MSPHKGAEDDSLMREFHRNTQTLEDTMLGGLGTLSHGEKLEATFRLLYLLKYIPSSES